MLKGQIKKCIKLLRKLFYIELEEGGKQEPASSPNEMICVRAEIARDLIFYIIKKGDFLYNSVCTRTHTHEDDDGGRWEQAENRLSHIGILSVPTLCHR